MLFLAYKWRKNALSEPLHHHPGEPSRPPSGNPLCLFLASSFSQASFLLQPVSEWTVILPPHRERLLTGRSVQARMRSSDAPAACRLPFLQAVLGEKRLHVFTFSKPPGKDPRRRVFRKERKEAGWLSIFQIPLQNPVREAWKDGKAWSFSFRKSFPSWNEVSEHAGASARLPGGLLEMGWNEKREG